MSKRCTSTFFHIEVVNLDETDVFKNTKTTVVEDVMLAYCRVFTPCIQSKWEWFVLIANADHHLLEIKQIERTYFFINTLS